MSAGAVAIRPSGSVRAAEAKRFIALVYTLAVTEWKLRFFGSVLGYLWTLIRPLMFFGVLYVVFTEIAKVGDKIPHYPVLLLANIVLYQFFTEATSLSVSCLVDREALLRKVRFPRLVIPLAVTLTCLFNLVTNMVAVITFALLSGVDPTWRWLELPLLVGALATLAVGVSLLLSVAFVYARDVRPIWEVFAQALFYGSPIFYTVDFYGQFEHILARTPIVAILTQLRHALVDPAAHSAADSAGGMVYLLVPLGATLGILVLGLWVFQRTSPNLAERL